MVSVKFLVVLALIAAAATTADATSITRFSKKAYCGVGEDGLVAVIGSVFNVLGGILNFVGGLIGNLLRPRKPTGFASSIDLTVDLSLGVGRVLDRTLIGGFGRWLAKIYIAITKITVCILGPANCKVCQGTYYGIGPVRERADISVFLRTYGLLNLRVELQALIDRRSKRRGISYFSPAQQVVLNACLRLSDILSVNIRKESLTGAIIELGIAASAIGATRSRKDGLNMAGGIVDTCNAHLEEYNYTVITEENYGTITSALARCYNDKGAFEKVTETESSGDDSTDQGDNMDQGDNTDQNNNDQANRDKADKERADKERADRERADKERADKERADQERADQERADQERADKERADKERADQERADKERAEKEQAAKNKAAKDKADKERADKERADKERADKERADQERADQERADKERAAKEQAAKNKAAKDKAAKDKADKERADKERADKERADKERADKERADQERADQERADKERAEKEQAAKNKAAKDKAAKDKADKERADKERSDKERADKERADQERADQERAAKERADKERADKEKAEKEKAAKDKAAKDKAAKDKAAKDKADKERVDKERADKERADKERADQERADKERADQERADQERADKKRADKDRADKERADKERADQERAYKEKAEKDKAAKDKAAKDKAAKDKADKERADKERADKERADQERADQERADKERADKQRADKERADKEKADKEKADREQGGQSGVDQSGDNQSGDNQSGDNQSGDNQSGDYQSGDNQSGDYQSGYDQSGYDQSGDYEQEGGVTTGGGVQIKVGLGLGGLRNAVRKVFGVIKGAVKIAGSIIDTLLNFKNPRNFDDSAVVSVQLCQGFGNLLDVSFIQGLGSLVIRIFVLISKISICLLGKVNCSVCNANYAGIGQISGDVTTIIRNAGLSNCHQDINDLIYRKSNGKGITYFTVAEQIVLNKILELSLLLNGKISKQTFPVALDIGITIFGTMANTYSVQDNKSGDFIISGLVDACGRFLSSQGFNTISQTQVNVIISTVGRAKTDTKAAWCVKK